MYVNVHNKVFILIPTIYYYQIYTNGLADNWCNSYITVCIIYSLTVADMCKSSSATEETNSGSFKVDSVVLRIMTQQDNCICRVTIDNQIQPVSIGLSKYGDLASSAPGGYNCGLEVDINHIPDMSTGNVIDPIECVVNSPPRNIAQLQNNYLQFRSRIINGNFSRGYCMQIRRGKASLQFVN